MKKFDASDFRLVMLESPFAGDFERNLCYWRQAMRHAIFHHHEAPFSSHFFYTQLLDDKAPEQRTLGISLGFAQWQKVEKVVFYMDLGLSNGMKAAEKRCQQQGKPYEMRWLGIGWEDLVFG